MIAGITGHQDLGPPDTVDWVIAALDSLVSSEGVTSGLTSLAEGADQAFARVLRTRGLTFAAVIPSKSYEFAFRSEFARAAYAELLNIATRRIELSFPSPTEEAFFEAGKYVVLNSDLLFAVWNGDAARGLGGTADVVQFALGNRRRTIHVNPVTRTIVHL